MHSFSAAGLPENFDTDPQFVGVFEWDGSSPYVIEHKGSYADRTMGHAGWPDLTKEQYDALSNTMRCLLILCSLLVGCTVTPTVSTVEINGRMLTEIYNVEHDVPWCGDRWAGCYDSVTNTAYYRPYAKQHTIDHERAHADGMVHTPWKRGFWGTEICATVMIAGGKYEAGDRICVTQRGETQSRP